MKQGYASAWQNNEINFDPKSGLLPVIFSRKITYGFVAQEFRNSMLQTDHNLELKRGRYDQLKQCYVRSMLLRDCI